MSDIKKFVGDLEVVKDKSRDLYRSFDTSDLECAIDYLKDTMNAIREWEREADNLGDDIESLIEEVKEIEETPKTQKQDILFWSMTSLISQAVYGDDYVEQLRELDERFEPFWKGLCYMMRDGSYEMVYKISKFLTALDTPEESSETTN